MNWEETLKGTWNPGKRMDKIKEWWNERNFRADVRHYIRYNIHNMNTHSKNSENRYEYAHNPELMEQSKKEFIELLLEKNIKEWEDIFEEEYPKMGETRANEANKGGTDYGLMSEVSDW